VNKVCQKCLKKRELTEFRTDPRCIDGHRNICECCRREKNYADYHSGSLHRNKDVIREWRSKNKDRVAEANRRYYEKKKKV
jgi:hypothetical protein